MKEERHAAILELIAERQVRSQEELRRLLRARGIRAAQATLSRDLRQLGVIKTPHPEGGTYYAARPEAEGEEPALQRLLPHLLVSVDGVGHLLVVRTRIGGAQAVAEAIDLEGWPEVLGTLAGDDTILIVVRRPGDRKRVGGRLLEIAGHD